jgi:chitodextrinase
VATQKTQTLLGTSKNPFAKLQFVLVAAVVAVSGIYMVSRIFAASASMTLIPSATSVNIGDTVSITVRENSSTDTVNAVQANVSYDTTRLQYLGVDDTGSAFGLVAATTNSNGVVSVARGVQGGSAPVTGDQLVTKINFKVLAGGSAPLTIAAGSAVVRSTDNVDILVNKTGTTLTLADLAAPSVPAGVTAGTPTVTSISLTWTASTDNVSVAGYRVFRNGNQIATPSTPNYTDTGLTPNTAYSYRVAAYDAAGNVSAQSTALAVTTAPDVVAPTVPGAPTSTIQTMTSITINWTGSTDNVAVASYRIYRNGNQVGTVNPTAALNYVDSGLAPNTFYNYSVSAVDSAGNASAQSPATSVRTLPDTQAPTAPTALTGSAVGRNVTLNWQASTDNVAVTGYNVYRNGTSIASIGNVTTYTISNAPTGSFNYTVTAHDAAGNTSAQSTAVTIAVYLPGDINKDTKVDVFDLSTLLNNWARTGTNTSDLNADSVVNIFDLSILLTNWTG